MARGVNPFSEDFSLNLDEIDIFYLHLAVLTFHQTEKSKGTSAYKRLDPFAFHLFDFYFVLISTAN